MTSPADLTPPASAERRRARPLSREERRDAIVDATVPLLVEHGAAITTRQIADAAGVAEGTLFRAFADKDEILHAAVVRSLDPAAAVAAIEALPDRDLRPLVVDVVDFLLDAQRIGMRVFAAAHQVLRLSHGPGDVGRSGAHGLGADVRERSARAIVGAIEHVLDRHRDELRVEPSLAARALFSLVFGNALPHLSGGDRLDAVQLADLVLGGIGARVASDPSP